jgi:hypothetical protein
MGKGVIFHEEEEWVVFCLYVGYRLSLVWHGMSAFQEFSSFMIIMSVVNMYIELMTDNSR